MTLTINSQVAERIKVLVMQDYVDEIMEEAVIEYFLEIDDDSDVDIDESSF